MPNPSLDGVSYQVRIKWRLHGQDCFNVLAFTSRGVQDLVEDLLIPVINCVQTHLLPVLSQDVTLLGADCKNLTGTVAQEASYTPTTNTVGGEAHNSLPSTNAAVIALRTSHVGRSGRGRMFIPGISEELSALSTLDQVFITAAIAFLACMAAAFIAGDPPAAVRFDWMIHSRKDNTFYDIRSYQVRDVVGTMRSRKVG